MNTKTLKIIIIDDEACIRDSLTWYLEEIGHEVTAAATPSSCDVYHGHSCQYDAACADVLLIDQHLPGLQGLEFIDSLSKRGCRLIRANIILMSGDSTSIDCEKARELGVKVVQKPMSFDFLDEWLEEVKLRLDRIPSVDKETAP